LISTKQRGSVASRTTCTVVVAGLAVQAGRESVGAPDISRPSLAAYEARHDPDQMLTLFLTGE
jgi:hypothetical protein